MHVTPKKRQPPLRGQSGITLVEMMVGIVVALIVVWGLSSVYVNATRGGRTTAAQNQLNQDLRAMMDIMVNDIRRAGYWDGATTATNPFTAAAVDIQIGTGNTCILYSYDAVYAGGTSGTVDAGFDVFGFRVSNGVVQTLDPTGITTTAVATCTNDAAWQNLTDERGVNVGTLSFDTGGSQCIAFLPATYDPTDSSTYVQWPLPAGSTGQACTAAAATAAGRTYPGATYSYVETRQVNITVAATSKSAGDTTLTSQLASTALVRNNRQLP